MQAKVYARPMWCKADWRKLWKRKQSILCFLLKKKRFSENILKKSDCEIVIFLSVTYFSNGVRRAGSRTGLCQKIKSSWTKNFPVRFQSVLTNFQWFKIILNLCRGEFHGENRPWTGERIIRWRNESPPPNDQIWSFPWNKWFRILKRYKKHQRF